MDEHNDWVMSQTPLCLGPAFRHAGSSYDVMLNACYVLEVWEINKDWLSSILSFDGGAVAMSYIGMAT